LIHNGVDVLQTVHAAFGSSLLAVAAFLSRLVFQLFGGLFAHKVVEDIHWHGEDDCRVVLGRDTVQRLKVA
jgi:hypothetical protein